MIAAVLAGLALMWVLAALGGPGYGSETRIEVLTTDPVRVVLPIDASAEFIESRMRQELVAGAAVERDPRMAEHLRAIARDTDLIGHMAAEGFAQFAGDVAAGIAYGFYDAAIGEEVVLYSLTIELLPSFTGVGETLSHEDGHWLVNSGIAQRCGPRIVRDAASGTIFPGQARTAIMKRLQEADETVHDTYHRLVVGATAGQHRVAALQALDEVVGPACERLD